MWYASGMKLLGIDYGEKKIGIALSDEDGTMAFPRSIVQNDADFLAHILELIAKEGVGAVVVGESKDFRGEDNPIMKRVTTFKRALEEKCSLPVYLEPELLSTKEANRPPDKQVSKEGGSGLADASAAAIILQSFINKQKNNHDND